MADKKSTRRQLTNIEFPHPAHSQYVKALVTSLYDILEVRKQIDNRVNALMRRDEEICTTIAKELKEVIGDTVSRLEHEFERRVGKAVAKMPVIQWLEKVHGIGPRYSGSLAAIVQDIERFPRISSIWAYFGMGLIPICDECNKMAYKGEERIRFAMRQAERRWKIYSSSKQYQELVEKGKTPDEETFITEKYDHTVNVLCKHVDEADFSSTLRAPQKHYFSELLLTHNPFAKMTVWKISGQFVRQGKFYRLHYDKVKARYVERDSGKIADWIIDLRARRAVSKLFLSHFWEMWRRSEGLPVGRTWLLDHQGMDFASHTYIPPPHKETYGPFVEPKYSGRFPEDKKE